METARLRGGEMQRAASDARLHPIFPRRKSSLRLGNAGGAYETRQPKGRNIGFGFAKEEH